MSKANLSKLQNVDRSTLDEKHQFLYDILTQGIDPEELQHTPTAKTPTRNYYTLDDNPTTKTVQDVLQEYNIDPAHASSKYSVSEYQQILDLAIENGFYETLKSGNGVSRIYTLSPDELNLRINCFIQENEPVARSTKAGNRIIINSDLKSPQKDFDKKYNLTPKKREKLSIHLGQNLLEDNIYSKSIQGSLADDMPDLTEEQVTLSNSIYSKIASNEIVDGIILQLGNHTYSVPKVKRTLHKIISRLNPNNVSNDEINEIIKAALLSNKSINQQELTDVNEFLLEQTKLEEHQEEPEIKPAEVPTQESEVQPTPEVSVQESELQSEPEEFSVEKQLAHAIQKGHEKLAQADEHLSISLQENRVKQETYLSKKKEISVEISAITDKFNSADITPDEILTLLDRLDELNISINSLTQQLTALKKERISLQEQYDRIHTARSNIK